MHVKKTLLIRSGLLALALHAGALQAHTTPLAATDNADAGARVKRSPVIVVPIVATGVLMPSSSGWRSPGSRPRAAWWSAAHDQSGTVPGRPCQRRFRGAEQARWRLWLVSDGRQVFACSLPWQDAGLAGARLARQGRIGVVVSRLPFGSVAPADPEHTYTVKLRARGSGALPARCGGQPWRRKAGRSRQRARTRLDHPYRRLDWVDLDFRVDGIVGPEPGLLLVAIERTDGNASTMLQVDDVRIERTPLGVTAR